MRKDIIRVKANQVRVGHWIAFPNSDMDFEAISIFKDGSVLSINEQALIKQSAHVFIRKPEDLATIRELKKGDFFKLKPYAERVYIRGDYIPGLNKYSCTAWDDTSAEIFKDGGLAVSVGFEF